MFGLGFLVFGFMTWAYYLHLAYSDPDHPGSAFGALIAAVLGAFGLNMLHEADQLPWISAWHVGLVNLVWMSTAFPLGALATAIGDRRDDRRAGAGVPGDADGGDRGEDG